MYVDTKLADVGFELVRFMKLQDILWKQMDPAVTMLATATTLPLVIYHTKNSNINLVGEKRNDPISRIFLHELYILHNTLSLLIFKHYYSAAITSFMIFLYETTFNYKADYILRLKELIIQIDHIISVNVNKLGLNLVFVFIHLMFYVQNIICFSNILP